jgi:hypothetical protein
MNYLPSLVSNRDSPDLCLLNSWDYRCELLALSIDECLDGQKGYKELLLAQLGLSGKYH